MAKLEFLRDLLSNHSVPTKLKYKLQPIKQNAKLVVLKSQSKEEIAWQ